MKLIFAGLVILQLALTTGCGRSGVAFVESNSEPLVPEEGDGYLMFDLHPLETTAARQRYDCSFKAEGKTARFQFEVTPDVPSGDPTIASASGKIVAVPGSDASVFLRRLQKTLEAKTLPGQTKRVPAILFTAAILGTDNSHVKNGGFAVKPPEELDCHEDFPGRERFRRSIP